MTSEFEGLKHDLSADGQSIELESSTTDSFELLSAYIDGELSPAEKKQVQTWLDSDPQFKQTYTQLLNLQGQIQNFVIPPNEKSTAEITAGVFESIDRSHRRRSLTWIGGAIAASAVAAISGIIPGFSPLSVNMAKVNSPNSNPEQVMLAVAIDQPAINIPKSVNGYYPRDLDSNQD